MAADVPMHASYEDKPGVPDRIFLDLDDDAFHRQVDSWTRFVAGSGRGQTRCRASPSPHPDARGDP